MPSMQVSYCAHAVEYCTCSTLILRKTCIQQNERVSVFNGDFEIDSTVKHHYWAGEFREDSSCGEVLAHLEADDFECKTPIYPINLRRGTFHSVESFVKSIFWNRFMDKGNFEIRHGQCQCCRGYSRPAGGPW